MASRSKNHNARELNLYSQRLFKNKKPFLCPRCNDFLLPKDFESHCREKHNINPKRACVWCWGRTTWSRGEKYHFGQHLLDCMQRFNYSYQHQWKLMCEPRKYFNHEMLPIPRAHDPVWPISLTTPLVSFNLEELNLAVACTQLYLNLKDEVDFYHVMVRAVAHESFLAAMDEDQGNTRTLPLSTWCNGGTPEQAMYRQHRHVIIVSRPKGHFVRNVWPKIKVNRNSAENWPVKTKKEIKSVLHLVNTLGYVSQRKSNCSFQQQTELSYDNHFYIQIPLPENYKIACAVQWEGGINELLNQQYRNWSIESFTNLPSLKIQNGKWQLLVRDLPFIPLDIQLPISNYFRISCKPTNYFIYLGEKLYFERAPYPLTRPPDIRFFEIVGDEVWYPAIGQQKQLHNLRSVWSQLRECRSENARLKSKINDTKLIRRHSV